MQTIHSEVLTTTEIVCPSCSTWQYVDAEAAQRKEHRCQLCHHLIDDRHWYTRLDEIEGMEYGHAYYIAMGGRIGAQVCQQMFTPGHKPPEAIEAGTVICPKCFKPVKLMADAVEWVEGSDGVSRATDYGPGEGVCCGFLYVDSHEGFRMYRLDKPVTTPEPSNVKAVA